MKNILLNRFLVLALGLLFSTAGSAQGWRTWWQILDAGTGLGNIVNNVAVMPNDSFVYSVNQWSLPNNYYFGEASADGLGSMMTNGSFFNENPPFGHYPIDMVTVGADSIFQLEVARPAGTSERKLFLSLYIYKFHVPAGEPRYVLQWHKELFQDSDSNWFCGCGSLVGTADGGFGALTYNLTDGGPISNNSANPILIKTDGAGEVIWSKTLADPNHMMQRSVVEAPDGGFWVTKTQGSGTKNDVFLIKTDAAGNVVWDKNLSGAAFSDDPLDMIRTSDGNLAIAFNNKLNAKAGLMKVSPSGDLIWRKDLAQFVPIVILEHSNSDLSLVGSANTGDVLIQKITASGDPIWEKSYGKPAFKEEVYSATIAPDGGYLVGGSLLDGNKPYFAYLFKTDANGWVYPGLITGNVFQDLNLDCTENTGDLPIEGLVVTAFRDSAHIFYGSTDSVGNYRIEADTGNFVVHLALPSPYWGVCANDVAVHLDYIDSAKVDFALSSAIDCPFMTVDLASAALRPCDTARFYVHYCNLGSVAATPARVEIALDPILTFIDAQIQPTSITGNVVDFPLGNVQPLECADFWFDAQVACDSSTGLTACTQAHIFPDSSCLPPLASWSGALIELTGQCEGDSVRFKLKNIGTGNSSQLDYIVIEDAVLLRTGSFQLDFGDEMAVVEATSGATFHVLAEQEPNAPGLSFPILGIENCENGDPVSLGFLNQFSENDADPFLSEWCMLVTNSFDPNDKQAMPTGFGAEKNIFADTELEYMIRFQNTGSDTAFRVILIDSLSKLLDPATVRLGASSHPCKLELEGDGVLRFTFPGIKLPQAAVNEAASNGFVTFTIRQKTGNSVGEIIQNRAGIFFDYNQPVITNWVDRRIHASFFEVTSFSTETTVPTVKWTAFPNPFADQIRFEIDAEKTVNAQLEVFSTDGKRAMSLPFSENAAVLSRGNLVEGAYFFSIKNQKGERLASGTILAK